MEILAQTTVNALLKEFPQLEEHLIALNPQFKKLKNPLLRNSIGKIANLKQAASIADIPLLQLINDLREVVGQPLLDNIED